MPGPPLRKISFFAHDFFERGGVEV